MNSYPPPEGGDVPVQRTSRLRDLPVQPLATVYSKPNCPACDATKRQFDKRGVAYEAVDITQDEAAFQLVRDLGHQQVPVVVAGTDHWSGFRPEKIKELQTLAAQVA